MPKDKKTVPRAEKDRQRKEKQAQEKEKREAERLKNHQAYQTQRSMKDELEEEKRSAVRAPEMSKLVKGPKEEAEEEEEKDISQYVMLFSESDDFVTIAIESLSDRFFWSYKRLEAVFRKEIVPIRPTDKGNSNHQSNDSSAINDEVIKFVLYQSQVKSNHFKLALCSSSLDHDVIHEIILVDNFHTCKFTLESLKKEKLSFIFNEMIDKFKQQQQGIQSVRKEDEVSPSEMNHQMYLKQLEERKQKEKQEHERHKQREESAKNKVIIKQRERKLDSKVGKDQSRNYAERDQVIVSGKERGKYSMRG